MKITIRTDNAAFGESPYEKADELRRIFNRIREQVECGYTNGCVMDINGNKACEWED